MDISTVVSTCACCGRSGLHKSTCRMHNEKCGICGNVGHQRKECRQREKSDGKGKTQKCSGKGKDWSVVTCYCCGEAWSLEALLPTSQRQLQNPCVKKMDTTCQVCRSCQGWRASARILDSEDKEEEHILEVRDVWALAKCTSTEPMLHDIGDDDLHMIMDSVPPQHVINPCGLATIGRARAATSSGALAQRCW